MKILTIDIGGTYIKYARMSEDMEIRSRGKRPTPQSGREALLDALEGIYTEEPVDGIAISLPGIIDAENGYVVMGGALRYNDDFYLRHALYQRCRTKIVLENDAKCAAMAEAAAGSLKDVPDGFVLIFGTMIGGAYIHDHRLLRGRHFSAGEVSYITTVRNGYPDQDVVFGNRCGVPRLCRKYAGRKRLDPDTVDGVCLFHDAEAGDEIALGCLDEFAHEVAVQIFNIQTLLDPDRFAIGGGISAQPLFLEAIRRNLKKLYGVCLYDIPQAEVVACNFQNDANLYGALHCFLQNKQ
ncbi:MAG: ROK family protein [Oscillospiraceae bacterium]|nr:ROK family protein [Oscillospiraceae bacterium]